MDAAAGIAVGDGRGYERDHGVLGAAIGIRAGKESSAVDFSRMIQKFGPTKIIDTCMTSRGYQIFSQVGMGGG